MIDNTRKTEKKADYSRPTLVVYGGLAQLTANGSIQGMEVGSMTATEKG